MAKKIDHLDIPVSFNYWSFQLKAEDNNQFSYDDTEFSRFVEKNNLADMKLSDDEKLFLIAKVYELHLSYKGKADEDGQVLLDYVGNNIESKIKRFAHEIKFTRRRASPTRMKRTQEPTDTAKRFLKNTEKMFLPTPSKSEIHEKRLEANLTQAEGVDILNMSARQLFSDYENGTRKPAQITWAMFLLLTDQHPNFKLKKR